MIKLFSPTATDFRTNGLAILNNCISCVITEELNGLYSLSLEYPIEVPVEVDSIIPVAKNLLIGTFIIGQQGKANLLPKSNYIQKDYIIVADGQPFRIYNVKRNMTSIIVTARHIFYDLMDNFLEDVRPTNLTGLNSIQYLLDHTADPHNFTCNGDVSNINTQYFVRKNVVNAIMGTDSIIANCGGELVRDGFNIGYWKARGHDTGVLIAGGKNLTGIVDDLDEDNVYTRLMPIGKDELKLPEKYIDSQYINNYPHPKYKTVDFNDITDVASLRAAGIKYMSDNKIDIPVVNYNVDFVALSDTEEYKDYAILQTVENGDIVTIRYDKLNLNIKAEVIKTTKKWVGKKWVYDKIELGNFKGNIATVLSNMANNMTYNGKLKANNIQGIIDATKATLHAMADAAIPQTEKAIMFEDRDPTSPTYGCLAIGTSGFEISCIMTNNEWQFTTFGTGKGFTADLLIVGKILGGAVVFDLDEGTLKINHTDGSYTLINADGFKRYVAGLAHEYQYLTYIGGLICNANQEYTITIPDEFVGTNWTVTWSISYIDPSDGNDDILANFAANISITPATPTTFSIKPFAIFYNVTDWSSKISGNIGITYVITA